MVSPSYRGPGHCLTQLYFSCPMHCPSSLADMCAEGSGRLSTSRAMATEHVVRRQQEVNMYCHEGGAETFFLFQKALTCHEFIQLLSHGRRGQPINTSGGQSGPPTDVNRLGDDGIEALPKRTTLITSILSFQNLSRCDLCMYI